MFVLIIPDKHSDCYTSDQDVIRHREAMKKRVMVVFTARTKQYSVEPI